MKLRILRSYLWYRPYLCLGVDFTESQFILPASLLTILRHYPLIHASRAAEVLISVAASFLFCCRVSPFVAPADLLLSMQAVQYQLAHCDCGSRVCLSINPD